MRARHVHYDLEHGFIQNWLVAGPIASPIETQQFQGQNIRRQVAEHYYEETPGITGNPVERGPLDKGLYRVGADTGAWEYYACREDHLVEHSGIYPSARYLRSWAFAQLSSKADREAWFALFSHGPADVWLNEKHVHRQENFYGNQPDKQVFKVSLKAGLNKILVRFENIASQAVPHAMALQVCNAKLEACQAQDGLQVKIPTLIPVIERRNKFERAAATTYISQDVFAAGDQIRLHWPAELAESSSAVVRLITPTNQIYAEATVDGIAGDQVFLQQSLQIPEGPYRLLLMPMPREYYELNLRITREIGLWNLGKSRYSAAPYGTRTERRREALTSAARWKGLFAEIAKMALGHWDEIEPDVIRQASTSLNPQDMIGLSGMLSRFGTDPQFPPQLWQLAEDCLPGFPFERKDIFEPEVGNTEAQQILSCTAEILAGQRYPERVFAGSGQTGAWHRQNGERLALAWLQQRGAVGFADWDSNCGFADSLLALSHLIDLADTDAVAEMAAIVMDKIFGTIALNSFQGVFGSTHGRTQAASVKSGLLEPTSGITRLMWGQGIFNQHIAGSVSLACMENYELPAIISDLAASTPDELWSQERHAVTSAQEVNKVTFKSPDGMLCSAQDYRPGQKGQLEHIWQATLGPNASVFVTHPACMSENDARQPNFWAGNAVLPRVAQWKDALIAVYQLPEDDWMGFTHAYFPTPAFDEYVIRQGWAFARKGEGYLALASSQPCEMLNQGPSALRELRAYGKNNIWLCHLGRAALDGDFANFQEKILQQEVKYTAGSVQWTTLRGEKLDFGWQGPFMRNEQEQPLAGFEHYQGAAMISAYPSQQLEISHGEDMMRLNFGNPSDPETT